MDIERLDHVNVQTHDLEATRDFYTDIIGLRAGDRPPFAFAGHWLYAGTIPVIHLNGLDASDPAVYGGAAVNHIAFRAAGLTAMRERLERAGVPYEERIVPRNGEGQIFVTDPNGVGIELTFTAAEVQAAGTLAHR